MLTALARLFRRPALASALNADAISLNILAARLGGLRNTIRSNQS